MPKKGTKVRSAKSEISMRAWRTLMRAASQGAFVVIPEMLRSNISGIINKGRNQLFYCMIKAPKRGLLQG